MDSLITVINKLHDVFNIIGSNTISLPQIVVVGSQSSGKSSVLESLVGRDFLPRGTGIVTRCPLILQLIYTPKNSSITCLKNTTFQTEEWGTFLHTGDKIFVDFREIRNEIFAEMEKRSGSKKGISSEAISLKIFSPNVVNLTLVDLPGITKVPVEDQPKDIEMQVKKLILQYISNPSAIILAVTPANTDFATSESLKFARECDPEGRRTLAVVTKLDLMDAGTDATDVLCGRVIPVRLGIIGVVNRSQQDIIDDKDINDAVKDEALFLKRNYPMLESRNGTEFLRKMLNKLLINHITDCLPHLKKRINNMISHYQTLIRSYGNTVTDPNQILLQIITKFASSYCSVLEGTTKNIETSQLSGGARICYIFHEVFDHTLESIDPLDGLNAWDILTAIRNSTGTRPVFFVSEVAFELLVKRQIQKLEAPSLKCVELVYDEMKRIISHCGAEIRQEVRRFPKLHEKIIDVVIQLLKERLPATNTMVESLISIELAYINTKHPDFYYHSSSSYGNAKQKETNAQYIMHRTNIVSEAPIWLNTTSEIKPHLEGEISKQFDVVYETKEKNAPRSDASVKEICDDSIDYSIANEGQNCIKSFSKSPLYNIGDRTRDERYTLQTMNLSARPDGLDYVSPYNFTENLTEFESKECKIIKHLIFSYFMIVKKNIRDAVPKAIMHFLVNYVKDNLQSELVTHLYKPENIENLLEESEQISSGRKEAQAMLQALHKSNDIISEIADITL